MSTSKLKLIHRYGEHTINRLYYLFEFRHKHTNEPLKVAEIARAVSIPERTIRRIIKDGVNDLIS